MSSKEVMTSSSKEIFSYCTDTSDAKILSAAYQLFLKPVALLNISIQIPGSQISGKTVSNYEVMEKIKYWAQPEEFSSLRVSKSTLEFIRLDGEIENRSKLLPVLTRLDGRTIKLSAFPEGLKVRAVEAKPDFPTRHDWDSYFRDAKNMNEMKPGERPDTVYLSNLPLNWFTNKNGKTPDQPSEIVLKRVFQNFGDIREIDIPINDMYRSQMKPYISGMTMFAYSQTMIFEAYVQFKEYIHFVKAMDALRGMKLLHVDGDKAYCANIKVDFDKTKHLSESSIRKRAIEREKLIAKEKEREEKRLAEMKEEERKKLLEAEEKKREADTRLERQRQREEKRKEKKLLKLNKKECKNMNKKIASEEYLFLVAQRKLQTIRLLSFLFDKIKETKELELKREKKMAKMKLKGIEPKKKDKLEDLKRLKEISLRNKLIKRFKKKGDLKLDKSGIMNSDSSGSDSSDESAVSADEKELKDATALPVTEPMEYPPGQWRGQRGNFRGQYFNNRGFRGRGRGGGFPLHTSLDDGSTADPSVVPPPTLEDGTTPNPSAMRGGGGFYQRRPRGARGGWMPRFPMPMRGALPPPFFPPFAHPFFPFDMNEYFKYFSKFKDEHDDRSHSRSRSRSRSRKRSRRSRSYSRSSRSYSSRSRSRSRSRTYSSRSRSYSRSRSRSRSRRSRSRSRSYSRSRSRDRSSRSRSRSRSRCSRSYSKERRSRDKKLSTEKDSSVTNGKDGTASTSGEGKSNVSKASPTGGSGAAAGTSSKKKHKKKKKSKKKKKEKEEGGEKDKEERTKSTNEENGAATGGEKKGVGEEEDAGLIEKEENAAEKRRDGKKFEEEDEEDELTFDSIMNA